MKKVKLVLQNGLEFSGFSFGYKDSTSGEVVFNTGMVGYNESLTDPSYRGQILVLTYPLIGNYGVPEKAEEHNLPKFFESDQIHVKGLIVSDYSFEYSHWNAKRSLSEWLKEELVPGIYGIDTRELTKVLREEGSMLGKIVVEDEESNNVNEKEQNIENKSSSSSTKDNSNKSDNEEDFFDPNKIDIVKEVTVKEPILYNKEGKKKIIAIDCGIKYNIIRDLVKRDLAVLRVPYDYDFTTEEFDGLFISNGPGDPSMCKKTIENIKKTLDKEIPTFGICLGNQLLAHAAGGKTFKLKYGHRSQNQPCVQVGTKKCLITTQNHGFAVDKNSLSNEWEEFFINANDGTNEGIKHKSKPFFSVQFHPEATPGPNDAKYLFDEFVKLL